MAESTIQRALSVGQINAWRSAPEAASPSFRTAMTPTEPTPLTPPTTAAKDGKESADAASRKRNEEQQRLAQNERLSELARPLVEMANNPKATLQGAEQLRQDLLPPRNPYPSPRDLARVGQAEEVIRRARLRLEKTESVDRRV